MLQKWIKPLKVPVSTFYIITFMDCSLVSWRSVIWWRVYTRTQINKPWNWSTCAESLFSKTLQGHQLKPREQHWFQSDTTPMCCPVPQWAGPCLRGFHWQHNRLAQLEAQGRYLVPYWENTQTATGGEPWLGAHCLSLPGRQWNPHFYTHPHKSSEHYLGSAVW